MGVVSIEAVFKIMGLMRVFGERLSGKEGGINFRVSGYLFYFVILAIEKERVGREGEIRRVLCLGN